MALQTIYENQVIKGLRGEKAQEMGESYVIQRFGDMVFKIIKADKNTLDCYVEVMKRLKDIRFELDSSLFGDFYYNGELVDYFSISFTEVFGTVNEVCLVDIEEKCFCYESKYILGDKFTTLLMHPLNGGYKYKLLFIKISRDIGMELEKEVDGKKIIVDMDTRVFFGVIPQIGDMNIKVGNLETDSKGKRTLSLIITDVAVNIREFPIKITNTNTGEKGFSLE